MNDSSRQDLSAITHGIGLNHRNTVLAGQNHRSTSCDRRSHKNGSEWNADHGVRLPTGACALYTLRLVETDSLIAKDGIFSEKVR
jgi:hypothetical protein